MSDNGDRSELPQEWEWKTLGDIGNYYNGRGFKKSEWREAGRPIIRIQNLNDPSKPFNYFDGQPEEKYTARKGDILMSWAATLDVFRWKGPEAVVNQHIFKVESAIDPDFHFWLLKAVLEQLYAKTHGTGMVHITRQRFLATAVPVPSRPEEQALQALRLESLMHGIARATSEVTDGRRKLAALERGLIDAAIWGDEFASEKDSVPEIEQQLVDERRATFDESGSKRKYREALTSLDPPDAPGGWALLSVDEVCALVTDGDHNPPKRVPKGIPHLTAKHVKNGCLVFEDSTFISPEDFERVKKRYSPHPGDVIVTCVGTIGRSAVVPESLVFSPDRNLAGLRPLPSIDAGYLRLVFCSTLMQQRMRTASGSTAQPHLYLGDLKRLPVPVPRLEVQHQIVGRVEASLARVRRLGQELDAVGGEAEPLTRSLLYRFAQGQLSASVSSGLPADRAEKLADHASAG